MLLLFTTELLRLVQKGLGSKYCLWFRHDIYSLLKRPCKVESTEAKVV